MASTGVLHSELAAFMERVKEYEPAARTSGVAPFSNRANVFTPSQDKMP